MQVLTGLELERPGDNVHEQLEDGIRGPKDLIEQHKPNQDGHLVLETKGPVHALVVDERREEGENIEDVTLRDEQELGGVAHAPVTQFVSQDGLTRTALNDARTALARLSRARHPNLCELVIDVAVAPPSEMYMRCQNSSDALDELLVKLVEMFLLPCIISQCDLYAGDYSSGPEALSTAMLLRLQQMTASCFRCRIRVFGRKALYLGDSNEMLGECDHFIQ